MAKAKARKVEFLEPRLRLFMGADIVGSTALKQSRPGANKPTDQATTGPSWFSAIQGFYFEAAQALIFQWDKAKGTSSNPHLLFGPDPQLWKTVGDEVLFVKVLTDHRQVATTLQCWIAALGRMKEFLRAESTLLDVKSTCWTAGFPFRNREVVLDPKITSKAPQIEDYYKENGRLLNKHYKNPNGSKLSVDYIGPSIDTGFRLSSFATGRKLITSVDVAYFLSMTQVDGEIKRFDLFYEGSTSLKGVLGGSNYPIFWLDMSDEASLSRKEDKLKTVSSCNNQDIREYCEEFYNVHSQFTFRPFVNGDVGQTLDKKPSWYDEYQSKLVENFLSPDSDYAGDDSEEARRPGTDISDEQMKDVISKIVPSAD